MSPRCRIVLLGSSSVGKTSIVNLFPFSILQIHHFLRNDLPTIYDPTIEDVYQLSYLWEGEMVKLRITDTAGKELIPGMRRIYEATGEGFIVVYSVKNRASLFEAIKICYQLGAVSKILVGTKADVNWRNREVYPFEGKAAARFLNCSFAETSSISGANNRRLFDEIILQIQEFKAFKKSQRNRFCCIM